MLKELRLIQGATGTDYYTVDRWQFIASSAGTWTVSQSTTVPTGEGFAYSHKFDCTTADASLGAGDYLLLGQKIEGINLQHLKYGTSSAEKLTLSFLGKISKNRNLCCRVQKCKFWRR